MAEQKTKQNEASVEKFLSGLQDELRKRDSFAILKIMEEITGERPKMWGTSIVGFGSYRYRYASGREGDWLRTGFSPRKQSLVLYIMTGFGRHRELMKKLGKYKTGKSCLYIHRLEDVDLGTLKQLIRNSVKQRPKDSL